MQGYVEDEPAARYLIEEKVGSGSYGCVYRVWDNIRKAPVAAKVLEEEVWIPVDRLDEEADETTISEMALRELSFLKILADAGTPCITRLLDFSFELGEHQALVAYMPLFCGDLSDALEDNNLTAHQRLGIGVDVLTAVAHLHAFRPAIVHRDIKPENVLLTEKKRGVLSDFGFACFEVSSPQEKCVGTEEERRAEERRVERKRRKEGSDNKSHSGILGTTTYIAPEVLRRTDQRPARDIWALGVLLLELLDNRRLDADSNREAFEEIPERLSALRDRGAPASLLRILRSFLKKSPRKRGTAVEALQALRANGYKLLERLPKEETTVSVASASLEGVPTEPWVALCKTTLGAEVSETMVAASLYAKLCPEIDNRSLAAIAAKVYEHSTRSDEDMAQKLDISIDLLEQAQETLLLRAKGCLLIPHIRILLKSLPRN